MYNRTELYSHSTYKALDLTVGATHLACFLFGVPVNLVSLYYFTRERLGTMDLPTYLYTLTALQDAIISLLTLNHGMTLLRYREVWLPGFCASHHVLFQMSQRMSVFLVAALSLTRTYTLVYPLRRVQPKAVLKVLAGMWVLMTCFFVLPPAVGLVRIVYHWEGAYCWAEPIPGKSISYTWDKLDNTMDTLGLAFPVIPMTVSCAISTYKIVVTRNDLTKETLAMMPKRMQKASQRISFTIIIVTVLYIIANIPLFINYVLYLITITCFQYPGPIYSSPFMYFYSWNITALLSTAVNATANPIVYFLRLKRYRRWLTLQLRGKLAISQSSRRTADLITYRVSSPRTPRAQRTSTCNATNGTTTASAAVWGSPPQHEMNCSTLDFLRLHLFLKLHYFLQLNFS